MKIIERALLALPAAIILLLAPTAGRAASGTWTSSTSGNWSDLNNWYYGSGPVADGAGSTADFSTLDLTADIYVTNDVPRTIGNMIFADTVGNKWWYLPASSTLTLDAGGGIPTITVTNMAVVVRTVLAGTSGLMKNGGGTLYIDSLNTYSGGTILSAGAIGIGTTGSGHLGSGPVTITNGSTLIMYRGDTTDDGSTVGSFTNGINIPSGETANLWCSPRSVSGPAGSASTFTPAVTGSGTLNLRVNGTARGGNGANFSAFSGVLNVFPRTAADNFAVAQGGATAPGFPNARVHLAAGVYMYQWYNPPSGTGTQTVQPIGELSGAVGSSLSGNPVSGRFVNWTVGYLNTTATFAGIIRNDTGAARVTKVGTGEWILSGINTYTGDTLVSTGKLTGVTGGSIANTTSFTVANGATNGVKVVSANGQWTTTNLIYSAGSTCLELVLGGSPSTTTAPLRVLGALTANGTINVSVYAGNVSVGSTYPLIQYDTLGGSGYGAFNLAVAGPHFTGHLVDNSGSHRIDLVVDAVTQPLRWATGSGDWDVNISSNWVDTTASSTTYQESSGLGDAVIFEDGASGSAPITVSLNTAVAPASLMVSNETKAYTLAGSGGIGGALSLKKLGASSLTLGVTNTHTGGVVVGGGTVSVNLANSASLGTGPVTITNGAILSLYRGDDSDDATVGYFSNPLSVPAGQTGTLWTSPRSRTGSAGTPSTFTPTVTGGGTLNLRVHWVGYIGGDWTGFTGQLNVTPRTSAEAFQIANGGAVASGFPNAKINLAAGVTMLQVVNPPSGSGTQTIQPIGELTGDSASILAGNPVSGRFVNWTIGGLNTSATFDGAIQDSVGAARITKVGTGAWTLSGTCNHTGDTVVSNGTLVVNGTINYSTVSNLAGTTLAGNGILGAPVDLEAGSTISPGVGGYGTLTCYSSLTFDGATNVVDISTTNNDLLVGYGGLYLNAGVVRLNISGTLTNGTYKLMEGYVYAGSVANLALTGFSQAGQLATLVDTGYGEIDLVVSFAGGANLTWVGDSSLNWWDINSSFNWTNSALTVYHDGDNVAFNDTGSVYPWVDIRSTVQPASVSVNASQDYTFQSTAGGKISGTARLTKAGFGTLTLLTPNDNSGGTLVSAGTVQVGNGATTGDIGTGNITNNGSLVFIQTDNRLVAGVVSGSGRLEQSGYATLTLQSDNTYAGGTRIGPGATLQVGNGGASGSVGTGAVTNDGTLAFNRSGVASIANGISGSGSVVKSGTSTLALGGVNTYQNNTTIQNGVLKLAASEVIPDGGFTYGSLILDGGAATAGTLDLNGYNESVNALVGSPGPVPGVITNSAATGTNTLTVGDDYTSTSFAGLIVSNSAGAKLALVKRGGAELTLAGANTYAGGTTVSGGRLTLRHNTAAGAGSITLGDGTTLNLTNSLANSGIFVGNDIITPAGATATTASDVLGCGYSGLFYGGSDSTNIVSGSVSCSAAGVKQYQNFTGVVRVASGAQLRFSATSLSVNGGDNAAFVVDGTLNTRNGNTGGGAGIALGALSGTGYVTGAGTAAGSTLYVIGARGVNATFSGHLDNGSFGNASLLKTGAGTQTFDGVLTYDGSTTVSNGVLALSGPTVALTNTPVISVKSGAALDVTGGASGTLSLGSQKAQTLSGAGTVRGSVVADGTFAATVAPGDSIGTLKVTGALTLAANSVVNMELNHTNAQTSDQIDVTNAITINGGTLNVTNLGPDLVTGDVFHLFNKARVGTGFTTVNLPVSNALNTIEYVWTNKLAINGTIELLSGASAVNLNPPPLVSSVSGGTLYLSWPTNAGWTLQWQTNNLGTGLSNNWVNVPGTEAVTATNFPVDATRPTVFYRLTYPAP